MERTRNVHSERIRMAVLFQQRLRQDIVPSEHLQGGWFYSGGGSLYKGPNLCPSLLPLQRTLYRQNVNISSAIYWQNTHLLSSGKHLVVPSVTCRAPRLRVRSCSSVSMLNQLEERCELARTTQVGDLRCCPSNERRWG